MVSVLASPANALPLMQSFGEVRQITRMPNGDIIVDFKRADVADTVSSSSAQLHPTRRLYAA